MFDQFQNCHNEASGPRRRGAKIISAAAVAALVAIGLCSAGALSRSDIRGAGLVFNLIGFGIFLVAGVAFVVGALIWLFGALLERLKRED